MQLPDSIWWNGIQQLLCLQLPAEGEPGQVLWVERAKTGMTVKEAKDFFNKEEIQSFLEENGSIPIVLCVSGTHIPHQVIAQEALHEPVSAVLGVNIDHTDDFEIMDFPADEGGAWVALSRKEMLNTALAQLGDQSERVIQILFHPGIWLTALPYAVPDFWEKSFMVTHNETVLWLKNGLVCNQESIGNGQFESINSDQIAHKLGVTTKQIYLASAAMYMWSTPIQEAYQFPGIAPGRGEYLAISKLQNTLKVGGGGILIALLVITGFWFAGSSKMTALTEEYAQKAPLLQELSTLEAEVRQKQVLQASLSRGKLRPTQVSYYLNEIGKIVPHSVSLEKILHHPLPDEIKKVGSLAEREADIYIQGESASSVSISEFHDALSAQKWLNSVELTHSEFNFNQNIYKFLFLLRFSDAG